MVFERDEVSSVAGSGGGGRMPDRVVDNILEQARVLYRFWPETLPDVL